MGVYLTKPVMDKESTDFDGNLLKCGASSMQGWRVSQEDAHNCCMEFDTDTSLFAVYDGHGGHEVAEYASLHLPTFIKENKSYKEGNFETALIEAFLDFDATLKTESVMEELGKIAKTGKKTKDGIKVFESEDEDEEDCDGVNKLREEAQMPLAEVIAMYANGGFQNKPRNNLIGRSTSKPLSPFLRASKSSSSKVLDSEVSSSTTPPSSSLTNGEIEEKKEPPKEETNESSSAEQPEKETNGEVKSASGCSSTVPEVSSSNGEGAQPSSTSPDASTSADGPSASAADQPASASSSTTPKKKRTAGEKMNTPSLLGESFASDDEDSSNDETFQANYDEASSSSDEEVHLNGSKGDDDEEEGGDDDEEEDEELDEESEEEEDDDEGCDDDEMSMNIKGGAEEPGMDSGCTAVVVLLTKEKLYVANAGDSRAVLCRNGTAIDLSVDHKPEDTEELKRIQNAGGKVTSDGRVNGGLNLSRALGDHFYKRSPDLDARDQMISALPDVVIQDVDRTTDEFIVLACDGIWNSLSSQQVVDFVKPFIQQGEKLSSICEKLFHKCIASDTMGDGTGCDNMTCIIVKLLQSESNSSNKRRSSTDQDPATAEQESSEVSQPEPKKVKLSEES